MRFMLEIIVQPTSETEASKRVDDVDMFAALKDELFQLVINMPEENGAVGVDGSTWTIVQCHDRTE